MIDPTPRAHPSRRTQLPEEVAAYVREQIMSGNLTPGQFLRLEPIAEAVGVSITPVREGLVALSNEGFVTAVPRRGFVVAPFTRQDVRDLFWAQSRLAGELAARAAKQITREELDLLGNVMEQCAVATKRGDADEIGRLGHQFHRIINVAARSDRLARLLAGVVKHLPNQYYASLEAHVSTAPLEHQEIFDALSKRQAKRARTLTEAHIEGSADFVIDSLEQRGLWRDNNQDQELPREQVS
ncbi:GntR family transcriptional regulator [Sinomonas humi]|uniref:GntR family transcriptional regulator n=1 Tax=Sinomonas humi TaxID=1338436 RepID=A0A0B2AI41_9MICC|nr:GntR family transcriptional regulator [Sinomonas humi]